MVYGVASLDSVIDACIVCCLSCDYHLDYLLGYSLCRTILELEWIFLIESKTLLIFGCLFIS